MARGIKEEVRLVSLTQVALGLEPELDINELVTEGQPGWVSYFIDGSSSVPEIPTGSVVFVEPKARLYLNCVVVVRQGLQTTLEQITQRTPHFRLLNGRQPALRLPRGDILGVVSAHLVLYRFVCADKEKVWL